MKITLPAGGTADLFKTPMGNIAFNFKGPSKNIHRRIADLNWLANEGFFDQEMGKFEPDPQVTELIQSLEH